MISKSTIKIYICAVGGMDQAFLEGGVNCKFCGAFLDNNFIAGPVLLEEAVNLKSVG